MKPFWLKRVGGGAYRAPLPSHVHTHGTCGHEL